jgi:HPt (histidine-containing phosphotransfer) domain-containing protein
MAPVATHDTPSAPIDSEALLSNFADADDLLHEIVVLFLAECPRRLAEMHRAVEAGDRNALRLVAHSFKGSLDTLGARRAAAAAAVLESCARSGDLDVARDACTLLEEELTAATSALARLVGVPRANPAAACG